MKPKFNIWDRVFIAEDEDIDWCKSLCVVIATIDSSNLHYYNSKKYLNLYSEEAVIDKIKSIREDRIVEVNRLFNTAIDDMTKWLEDWWHYY